MIISKVLPRTLRFLSIHSKAHLILQYIFAVVDLFSISIDIHAQKVTLGSGRRALVRQLNTAILLPNDLIRRTIDSRLVSATKRQCYQHTQCISRYVI